MTRRWVGRIVVTTVLAGAGACASTPKLPPAGGVARYPGITEPEIPAALRVSTAVRERHDVAWRRLQSGDRRGATRDYQALLNQDPAFYPAEAGLGDVLLADENFKAAAARFSSVLGRNDRYVPAWIGFADAQLGQRNDAEAVVALERVLALDPKREAIRSRLDIAKLRQVQSYVDAGKRARQGGRLEEARTSFARALALSPDSTMLLHELAVTELAAKEEDAAEAHARRAVQIDADDAEAQVTLADVLEARGKFREAAAVLTRANTLEPRADWRERAVALREKADLAAVPPEFREVTTASTITRAQVAAYVGLKLPALLEKSPKQMQSVMTDIRNHWAAPWIVPITQAGVMDVFANHTFQPGATVRRNDLAQVVSRLVTLASTGRPADLARWQADRPRFADLPSTNVYYRAVALAVAAGAMTADGDRFQPARPATGADLAAAITRVEQLSRR